MDYCPKNAEEFNAKPTDDAHGAAWCRRQYQANSQRCHGCKLGQKYGVVKITDEQKAEKDAPIQSRLF